jgi:hypothetical protein
MQYKNIRFQTSMLDLEVNVYSRWNKIWSNELLNEVMAN